MPRRIDRRKVGVIAATPVTVPADVLAQQIGEPRRIVYAWRAKLGLSGREVARERWRKMIQRVLDGEAVKKVAGENGVHYHSLVMKLHRWGYEKRWVKVR